MKSASKINTNFDTLYTLVNGNLDDNNISGISASKITSGTIDGARIDNVSASVITGTLDNSSIPKPADSIVLFATPQYNGNLGGRSGADQICKDNLDNETITMFNNSCSNVRAVITVSSSDEIRDMASNYGVPTNKKIRGTNGVLFANSWDNVTGGENAVSEYTGNFLNYSLYAGIPELARGWIWTGSGYKGEFIYYNSVDTTTCYGWTSNSAEYNKYMGNLY